MNRRRLFSLLVALGCWAPLWVAAQDTPSPAIYFPLAVGNRWVYEFAVRSDNPSELDQSPQTEVWEITGRQKDAFTIKITLPEEARTGFNEFIVVVPDGLERVDWKTDPETNIPLPEAEGAHRLFLKAPVAVGTFWKNKDGRWEITAIDEKIVVPAGVFEHCIEVTNKSESGKVTIVAYYAPGVGVIMREETFPRLEGSFLDDRRKAYATLRLKEWKVNGTKE